MAKGKTQKKLAGRVGDDGPRQNKADSVADFKERYERSSAVLLTEYRGLKVNQLGDLRTKLRDAGAEYKVYKNTLATIAVRDLGIEEIAEMLEGPVATVFAVEDAVATAKALAEFAKEHEMLVIKGGLLDGKSLSADDVKGLAKLDSREVMLAKIAGMFQSPIQKTANLFASPLNKVGALFAQLRDKLPEGGAPTEAPAQTPTEAPADAPAEAAAPAAESAEAPAAEASEETPAADAPAEAAAEETPAAEGDGQEAQDEGK
ncbi:MAG: 50S ribosomal protein L10 [Actinomycetota bacterium]